MPPFGTNHLRSSCLWPLLYAISARMTAIRLALAGWRLAFISCNLPFTTYDLSISAPLPFVNSAGALLTIKKHPATPPRSRFFSQAARYGKEIKIFKKI